MRRVIPAIVLVLLATAGRARAAEAPPAPAPTLAPTPAPVPAPPAGLAVVALRGATDAAWPLAQTIYADAALRPASIDEAHARVLCGEPPPPGAPADLHDLADTVAALHGDDAPSRVLLDGLARRLGAAGIVVVALDPARSAATARVFVQATGAFDAASYGPNAAPAGSSAAAPPSWSAAAQSLARAFGTPPTAAPQARAPALATHAAPANGAAEPSRRFYESGWFWGAIGLAALTGGAVFLSTRNSSDPTIHLEAQVPR